MGSVNSDIYTLSNEITDFCERNGISKSDLDQLYKSEAIKNKKLSKINGLVYDYGVKDASGFEITGVCVKDIIGFEPFNDKNNLYDILNICYSDGTSSYGLRVNDKLELSKDEMLKDIDKAFSYEPPAFDEINGKFLVSYNGCHRASILKLLYEDEVLKGESPVEEINKKYTIKGKVSKYDMTLTYMNYLLQMMKAVSYITIEYDDIGNPTGKYVIVRDDRTNASRDDIINLFNENLKNNADKVNLDSVNAYAENIPSFRDFLKKYVLKENEYGNSRNNL